MKVCPKCKRQIDDDSVYCGYCSAKQPYVPEEEKDEEETGETTPVTAPAGWRCGNCGEQLEDNFDTCWKCGTVKARSVEVPAEAESGEAAGPLLTAWGSDNRVDVYPEKVLITPSDAAGASGQAANGARCVIRIKDIVTIEFTSAKESGMGCMAVNFAAAPPDDITNIVYTTESVHFDALAEHEVKKVLELIKKCRADLDRAAQDGSGNS